MTAYCIMRAGASLAYEAAINLPIYNYEREPHPNIDVLNRESKQQYIRIYGTSSF